LSEIDRSNLLSIVYEELHKNVVLLSGIITSQMLIIDLV